MRFTPDEWAQLEFDFQERIWANYEWAKGMYDPETFKRLRIAVPDERLTLEQLRNRFVHRMGRNTYFSMDKVVTGARRNWKGR